MEYVNMNKFMIGIIALVMLLDFSAVMAEIDSATMDHSAMDMKMDHSAMSMKKENSAVKTGAIIVNFPASGKAREAGYEGNYNMKQTTVESSSKTKCKLAQQGIIMLDRASWARCNIK